LALASVVGAHVRSSNSPLPPAQLNLDINRLEMFPSSIGQLRHLETLSCNRNWLYELPIEISELKSLTELILDGNFIAQLPEGIGDLKLTTLKLAHNRLEYLEDDCLRPNLVNSLAVFWVSSNNLIELPHSFVDMKCLDDMKIEYGRAERDRKRRRRRSLFFYCSC
jgi:hypothetical protein